MMSRPDAIDVREPRTGGTAKTLGWCFGALIVAVAMSFAANILVIDVLDAALDPLTGGAVVPDPVTAVVTALLVGGAAGAVVGSRVLRGPILASCAVVAVYLSLWPWSFMGIQSGAWLAVSIVAHFPFAAGAARLMTSRKERKGADRS